MATFITDIIKEEYRQWKTGDQIVFDTQTGTGKTTFIFDVLLPYAAEQGESILYLVNRVALRRQLEKRLLEKPEKLQRHMTIISYQEFILRRKHGRYGESTDFGWTIDRAKYWVLDEAHYFLADNVFNSGVADCVDQISRYSKGHVLIFITATTTNLFLTMLSEFDLPFDTVRLPSIPYVNLAYYLGYWEFSRFSSCDDLLLDKEIDLTFDGLRRSFPDSDVSEFEHKYRSWRKNHYSENFKKYAASFDSLVSNLRIYSMPRSYDSVHPVYYLEMEEIVDSIFKSAPDEKWLIFVDSKAQGRDLEKTLLLKGIDSVFIESNSKRRRKDSVERQAYEKIVKEKQFTQRVLISTSVLDNGIDIADDQVKHVVIELFDETTFLQMLGRRRFPSEDNPINLYIKAFTYGALKQRFSRNILSIVHFLYFFNREKNREATRAVDPYQALERYLDHGKFAPPFANYLTKNKDIYFSSRSDIATQHNRRLLLDMYSIIPLHKVKLEYQYYYFLSLFERNINENPNLQTSDFRVSLDEQLSWLGKKYDDTHWINYKEQIRLKNSLERRLRVYSARKQEGSILGVQALNPIEQEFFKQNALDYAKELRPRHPLFKTKGSVKKINEALEDWGYPYRVISKSRELKGVKRNYWHIVHITETGNSDEQPSE